jgi:hypothetical protein
MKNAIIGGSIAIILLIVLFVWFKTKKKKDEVKKDEPKKDEVKDFMYQPREENPQIKAIREAKESCSKRGGVWIEYTMENMPIGGFNGYCSLDKKTTPEPTQIKPIVKNEPLPQKPTGKDEPLPFINVFRGVEIPVQTKRDWKDEPVYKKLKGGWTTTSGGLLNKKTSYVLRTFDSGIKKIYKKNNDGTFLYIEDFVGNLDKGIFANVGGGRRQGAILSTQGRG